MELFSLSATEIVHGVQHGEYSAVEVAQAALRRIESVEPLVRSFLTITPETALEQAEWVDREVQNRAAVLPLAGVPVALKDNMCTKGVRTTAGSAILEGFRPPYNATVVQRLQAAGAVLVGKANCDEFAMGSSTENSAFGPSRNPWDTTRVPGGSSGGSASAVAARQCPISLGSDTGGSIRQPASLCGIVGLKPTYGRISRYGLLAYASSLDQIGPFSRTVRDCALVMNVISGRDPRDSTSVDQPVPDFTRALERGVKGLRIGVPREYFGEGVSSGTASSVRAAVEKLCAMGAIAEECSLPHTHYALAAYYIVAPAEASSNLARYDGVRFGLRSRDWQGHIGLMERTRDEGFGAEVKQRIMIGTYALSAGYYDAYYRRAQQVRTLIRRDFEEAFARFDVLATPTSPTTAFKIGEKSDDPLAMKRADICTIPANMAGIPGISIPCGFEEGLPVGLQLLGRAYDEETLFSAAGAYEQATDWHQRTPTL